MSKKWFGQGNEVWVEDPKESRFFEHAYRAWQQGSWLPLMEFSLPERMWISRRIQYYRLPEDKPVETKIIERTSDRILRLESYPFSRLRPPIR